MCEFCRTFYVLRDHSTPGGASSARLGEGHVTLNASWGFTRIGEIVVCCHYQRTHTAIQEAQVMRSFEGAKL